MIHRNRPQPPLSLPFWEGPWPAASCLLLAALALFSVSLTPPPGDLVMAGQASDQLHGSIQRLRGNQQPGIGRAMAPSPAVDQEVVMVRGRVQPMQLGDPFLPAASLRAPILSRARSDASGSFHLLLEPALDHQQPLTLLLVVPGGFYLNRFEGSGHFATLTLPPSGGPPIVLVDDRGASF
jgi:hypothetical protein